MMPSAPLPPSSETTNNAYADEAAMLEHYRRQHLARLASARSAPPPVVPSMSNNNDYESEDARLARRLQQEEADRQYAKDIEQQLLREEELSRRAREPLEQPPAVLASVYGGGAVTTDQISAHDQELARRMAQQLHDEDVARQFALAEEQALAAREANGAVVVPPNSRSARRRCLCTYVVPCVTVAVGVVVVYMVLSWTSGDSNVIAIPGFGKGIDTPFMSDSDPFDGLNPWEVARWRTDGSEGLSLTIVNALEESWNDVFPVVVSDWDNGIPDALTLTVEKALAPDSECEAIEAKSKVCNGDYGDTQWKGINLAVLEGNFIVASTSKMNEFYLNGADASQKRYTLCHETGHSFGLPHTDEDFYNKDLGNCMDYTANPEANQQPDGTNYAFLQDLYGSVPGTATAAAAVTTVKDDNNRHLSQTTNVRQRQRATTKIPSDIRAKLSEIVPAMEKHDISSDSGLHPPQHQWRLLHASPHGQAHEMDLGNGWTVRIHKLLVSN